MNAKSIKKFKEKLICMKKETLEILQQIKKNEAIKSSTEMSSELSFYDNHPADSASIIYDMERGMAFQKNEVSIMEKIDDALERVEKGTYGICRNCGSPIDDKRLEFVPYAEYCIDCQRSMDDLKPIEVKNRPVEEDVLSSTMKYGYNKCDHQNGFDLEDSYQAVGKFNRRENIVEEYEDKDEEYVEPVEKISNRQYKDQLP